VRAAAYHAVFAGAAGHTYGHVSVWDFFVRTGGVPNPYIPDDYARDDWQQALDAEGAGQMRHLKDLMLTYPYVSCVPDDAIVLSESGAGTDHVSATRDADGGYAMIYLPRGGDVTVATDRLSGPMIRASWFDPRNGESRPAGPDSRAGAELTATAPSSGADTDWVLVLENSDRDSLPPPE
jgi:hypothetical protein